MDRMKLIIGILTGVGVNPDDMAPARRRSGALDVAFTTDKADKIVKANADRIERETHAAGHQWAVKFIGGHPYVTDVLTINLPDARRR